MYSVLQLAYFIWNAKLDVYTYKQYVKDLETFNYPIDVYTL